MQRSQVLANRFREVILNGTWIANTNFQDQLSKVSWEIAIKKVDGFNTIALLAQHIHYYICGIKNVLEGGDLSIRDKYSFDFTAMSSQEDWNNFLNTFWNDAEHFASLVEQLSDEELEAVFVNEKYGTYSRNIDAMIEHSYYHLGQIVLLRKMIDKWK